MALMNMPIKVLMTAGYRWSLTSIAFVCLILNAALNVLAVIVLDEGLQGAAAATAASYLVTFLLTTGFSLSRVVSWRKVAVYLGEIVVVFIYVYAAMRGVEWLLGASRGSFFADAGLAAAKFALYAVAVSPWLWLCEKRLGGLTMLRDLAGGLRRR
jgi:hypothetical protein